jgi:hypothetical protein
VYFISQIGRAIITRSKAPVNNLRTVRKIARSEYFDRNWYLEKNPDVAISYIDPARHYFTIGWREGRDPSPIFSNRDYLRHNPDVARMEINPLAHYIVFSASEKRIGGVIKPIAKKYETIDPLLVAAAVRYRSDTRPVILMLLHQLGGGAQYHVYRLAETLATQAQILILKVGPSFVYNLSVLDGDKHREFRLHGYSFGDLRKLLNLFNVQRIHVHHTYGFSDLTSFLSQVDLPYDLTIHDYMLVCPRIYLYREGRGYCGEPDETACTECLRQHPPAMSLDIVWWRWKGRELIEGAERVICPSRDCALRIVRYAPQAKLVVIPHEKQVLFNRRKARVPPLSPGQPMRVIVLGVMSEHKGGHFLLECVSAWKNASLAIEVTLIGEALVAELVGHVSITGPYEPAELPRLIADIDPHLIFYPQRCPETYSYTLSEGLMAGAAILAPDLGAFSERVQGAEWCWLYDPASDPDELTELMRRIRIEHVEKNRPPSALPRQSTLYSSDLSRFSPEKDYMCETVSGGTSSNKETW